MDSIHADLGRIVRYGPSRLLIDTNTALKQIHSHSANNLKSVVYQVMVHGAPNTLTIRRKEDHAWRRKILSLGLSDSRMLSYESIVKKHIMALLDNMEENSRINESALTKQKLDMSRQSDYFTFDVMSEAIFGVKYNALKEPTYRFVAQALEESNVRISALVQAPMLMLGRLDKPLFRHSIRGRNKFLGFISGILRDRANATGHNNVFSFLESAKEPDSGKVLDKSQIRAECATLVVAGSDTSSSTLAATLFYLSRNSRTYDRVCKEVRANFANQDDIGLGPRLNSCTYLRACIDESLRMSPPVGGALWREISPGGMIVDSISLPAGVDVGTGIYSIHHNADYHREPMKFIPERWIAEEPGSSKESVELSRSAFAPFSTGPRSCVGKGFAYHEITLTLAHIIQRFDFFSTDHLNKSAVTTNGDGGIEEFLLSDHITGAKKELGLYFTRRC